MGQGRRRKVMLLIAIVIVLIVCVGGVFAYIYFCTDTFRSGQELFAKYLTQNMEKIAQIVIGENANEIEEKLGQNKYEEKITLSYIEADETEPMEQITIDIQNDSINKKAYGILSMMRKNFEKPLEVEYMQENDMYSLRFTNSVKQFFTVENANLKQLATNLGLDEELIEQIPDKIDFQQLSLEELKLTDEEKNTEINKYANLLYSNIAKDKYTKSKEVAITLNGKTITTNAYTLTLNNQDIKNIVVKLLETLKKDEIVISKLQILQSKMQLLNETIEIDSETLKENYEDEIQKIINGLNEEKIIEGNIVITIYQEKGNTARIKLEQALNSITIDTTETDEKKQIDINFTSIDGEEQETSELIIELSENENNIKLDVTYMDKEQNTRLFTGDINFVEKIDYKVVLDNSNNIVLNELTSKQIADIFNALKPRLNTDYVEPYVEPYLENMELNGQNFTVTIDSEHENENGIVIYEELENKHFETSLKSDNIEFFSIISENWLPEDINNEGEGSHNGEYYIAYTFYAENMGQNTVNYWTTIEIDDVVKNMDEAIRIMVFKNDSKVIYAKNNSLTGLPESDTVRFHDDNTVMQEMTENFEVGDIDKYTVVIWLEGNDSDATDDLIGGTIKMHMNLTEENIVQ